MKFIIKTLLLLGLLTLSSCFKQVQMKSKALLLVAAYPVESEIPVELSGLTLYQGKLYTIADKVDTVLFRIEIEGDVARLYAERSFKIPEDTFMDWEGITVDQEGNFYLVSESSARIAKLEKDNDQAVWITPDLSKAIDPAKGLFTKTNAGLEGIIWLEADHFLLAVEREARGLIEYRKVGDNNLINGYRSTITRFGNELSVLRLPDFSGLAYDGGDVWALFRNASLIVQLEKTDWGYRESALAYSYASVENDPQYQYRDTRFGHAEGLAIDDNFIYIVMDNNRSARKTNSSDRRSQLFIFKKP